MMENIRELGEVYRSKFGFLPQDFKIIWSMWLR